MSSAIKTIRQGRGLGISEVPVIDLALVGDNGKKWHILGEGDQPICPRREHGAGVHNIERELDAKVVEFRGKPVCARCRTALGDVPMPSLVSSPIHKRR